MILCDYFILITNWYFYSGIEENDKYGPCIVGIGGPRNSNGYLEMDAAIMNGKSLDFGAVTALKG